MLFNVVTDPNETTDLSLENAEMVQRLSSMITKSMPIVESNQASSPPPNGYFRKNDGESRD